MKNINEYWQKNEILMKTDKNGCLLISDEKNQK